MRHPDKKGSEKQPHLENYPYDTKQPLAWRRVSFFLRCGSALVWLGLARFGLVWRAKPHRRKKTCRARAEGFFFLRSVPPGLASQAAQKKKKKTAEPGRKGNYFFFGAARLGFGLVWFGRQAAPKKKKSAEPGGRVFRLLRRGSDLVQLGLVRLGLALLFESF